MAFRRVFFYTRCMGGNGNRPPVWSSTRVHKTKRLIWTKYGNSIWALFIATCQLALVYMVLYLISSTNKHTIIVVVEPSFWGDKTAAAPPAYTRPAPRVHVYRVSQHRPPRNCHQYCVVVITHWTVQLWFDPLTTCKLEKWKECLIPF
jgi:hypothetical protein